MNKGILIPVLASIILLGTLGSGIILDDAFAKQEKVTICHKPGTPAEQTLEIAAPAVPAHLAHGDTLGQCGAPPEPDPVTIDPSCGVGGSEFTITDPQGRFGGTEVIIFIDAFGVETNAGPGNLIDPSNYQGTAPTVDPGDYTVEVRETEGDPPIFDDVLSFLVNGSDCFPAVVTIDPSSGFAGTAFTITDPGGRIQPGDLALFYEQGSSGDVGTPADNVIISADGTTLTGNVPASAAPGTQHFVAVRATPADLSRFADLAFFVDI